MVTIWHHINDLLSDPCWKHPNRANLNSWTLTNKAPTDYKSQPSHSAGGSSKILKLFVDTLWKQRVFVMYLLSRRSFPNTQTSKIKSTLNTLSEVVYTLPLFVASPMPLASTIKRPEIWFFLTFAGLTGRIQMRLTGNSQSFVPSLYWMDAHYFIHLLWKKSSLFVLYFRVL